MKALVTTGLNNRYLNQRRDKMTEDRRLKLLRLTKTTSSHKEFYSEYCKLRDEGLVNWQLGRAYLTNKGKEHLKEKQNE